MAGSIGALAAKGVDLRVKGSVKLAKSIAGPSLQAFGGAQNHLSLNRQIGGGGAKKIGCIDQHLRHIAQRQGRIVKAKGHIHAFGQKILDQERLGPKRRRIKVGINRQVPAPPRRAVCNGKVKHMPPRARVICQGANVFHPVRPRQNAGQRQTCDGRLLGIARQGRSVNRLTHTIRAAIGCQEHIDRRRGLSPFNAAI